MEATINMIKLDVLSKAREYADEACRDNVVWETWKLWIVISNCVAPMQIGQYDPDKIMHDMINERCPYTVKGCHTTTSLKLIEDITCMIKENDLVGSVGLTLIEGMQLILHCSDKKTATVLALHF